MALGEILVSKKKITFEQLEDALVHQKFFAGKAGTHLVELGYLSLPDLEKSLSEFFQVPSVSDGELENIDDFCRHQFPIEMIERFQVIPFKLFGGVLSAAMTNPDDHASIAYLRKILQCRLEVFSISEIRFQYFLFRLFNREWKNGDSRIRNLFIAHRKRRAQSALGKDPKPKAFGVSSGDQFVIDRAFGLPTFDDEQQAVAPVVLNDPKLGALGIKPLDRHEELVKEADPTWLYLQETQRQPPELPKSVPAGPTAQKLSLDDVDVEFAVIS